MVYLSVVSRSLKISWEPVLILGWSNLLDRVRPENRLGAGSGRSVGWLACFQSYSIDVGVGVGGGEGMHADVAGQL
ncbi:hypothetical protein T4E_2329 [Trichinella pseudospiralis]|uniref:Uncharacterized protein n=1 Tax=Trichinella pseudospiralis TaxID=6337 RepID=A0A0V0XPI6_TRIPS|nr:hypothetical protein T4E_2329 [Trichinella pseudospiralis]